jgi:hypothetical protein
MKLAAVIPLAPMKYRRLKPDGRLALLVLTAPLPTSVRATRFELYLIAVARRQGLLLHA